MSRSYHFISGLPRSGSTLLSALLKQNPQFHAGITSPLNMLVGSIHKKMAGNGEFSSFFDDKRKRGMLQGVFDNYYCDTAEDSIIFDTNRAWTARIPLLRTLYPTCKIICCVRDVGWIVDSVERMVRKNPLHLSQVFNLEEGSSVYGRAETLMNSDSGLVGRAWATFREAWFSEFTDALVVVPYDALTANPVNILRQLYEELQLPYFRHSESGLELEEELYDQRLGMPGMHSVRKTVEASRRELCIPPDLFEKYSSVSFWARKNMNPRNVKILGLA